MAGELIAVFLAVGVPLALRLVDYLLPPGRRFRVLDRFTTETEDTDETE